jgi:prepilin-type N-terminal cleavage/methylation domain-containing protein
MKEFLKKSSTRIITGQGGFTLIEMIVVVGIIAVLAAVIVPNIGKFIGTGESGAQDAEQGSVETAIAAMMAETPVSALTAHDQSEGATSTNSWINEPQGINVVSLWSLTPGDRYIQDQTTNWFYCWDAQGNVTNSVDDDSRISAIACED